MHRQEHRKPESWQVKLLEDNPGLANYTLWPDQVDVTFYFFDRGLDGQDASFLAKQKVKEAKAEQFLEEHPKAPRRWRTLCRENKSF